MEYRDYKNKKQLQKGSLDRTFSFEKKIKEEDEKINLLKNELAKIDVPTVTRKVKKRKVFSLIICLIALLSSIPFVIFGQRFAEQTKEIFA